ncbi:MAG TPA: HD domain-containing phosphohydrolase, partial [Solirubrobacteraceae bacterium]
AARALADELRARVERTPLELDGELVTVTFSAGVAGYPEHGESAQALLGAADAAMYDAKVGGRNRVRLALPADARRVLAIAGEPAPRPLQPVAVEPPAGAVEVLRDDPEPVADEPAPPAAPSRRLVRPVVAALLVGAGALAAVSDPRAITTAPALFGLLVLAVLAFDGVRIDLFERANISPASAPTLALAHLFGPLGPLVAEATIALVHCLRGEPRVKWAFDLGALTLSGAAAALTFRALPTGGIVELLIAGPVAGLAYYAVNAVLLSVVMALSEGDRPVAVWRERLAWLWPHYVLYGGLASGLIAAERSLGLAAIGVFAIPLVTLWLAQKQYVDRSRASVTELRAKNDELQEVNRRQERLLNDNGELLARMQRSYLSTITSLARTIEAKDPYTGGHTERVARVTLMLAAELGLRDQDIRAVEVGAVIHDIGKIGVPDAILLKPGRLDDEEFAEMRRHPEISSYIVAELDVPAIVKQMVRSHHERYDGRGYPDGLAGEEIPLAARILTVADTLDAMTSDRPYRRGLPLEVALEEIRSLAGAQFCPRVVAALFTCLDRDATLDGEFAPAAPLDEPRAA